MAFLRYVWTEKQVEVRRGGSYIRGISAFVISCAKWFPGSLADIEKCGGCLVCRTFPKMSFSLTHRPFCTRRFVAGLIITACDRDGIPFPWLRGSLMTMMTSLSYRYGRKCIVPLDLSLERALVMCEIAFIRAWYVPGFWIYIYD